MRRPTIALVSHRGRVDAKKWSENWFSTFWPPYIRGTGQDGYTLGFRCWRRQSFRSPKSSLSHRPDTFFSSQSYAFMSCDRRRWLLNGRVTVIMLFWLSLQFPGKRRHKYSSRHLLGFKMRWVARNFLCHWLNNVIIAIVKKLELKYRKCASQTCSNYNLFTYEWNYIFMFIYPSYVTLL
jgi:hypothetical protein